jgi:hypothetical protein
MSEPVDRSGRPEPLPPEELERRRQQSVSSGPGPFGQMHVNRAMLEELTKIRELLEKLVPADADV